jgi:hypothetical protein
MTMQVFEVKVNAQTAFEVPGCRMEVDERGYLTVQDFIDPIHGCEVHAIFKEWMWAKPKEPG